MSNDKIFSRLQVVREVMRRENMDVLIVPTGDPHLSEYLPEHWQGRQWLSGFTGSAGTLLISQTAAALFTDSRYWAQAESELPAHLISLERLAGPAIPAYIDWITRQSVAGAAGVVAVDGFVLSLTQAQALEKGLLAASWRLRTDADLLQEVWLNRPALPTAPIYAHPLPYPGLQRSEKLAQLRQTMQLQGVTHHVISSLDDIAWVVNLRGSDIEHNPVFVSHLLLDQEQVQLFVPLTATVERISLLLAQELKAIGVAVYPYEQFFTTLKSLAAGSRILLDPKRVSVGLQQAIPSGVQIVEATNPTTFSKATKTASEVGFIRESMERDAAAMAIFYAWFESALGRELITELTVDERLTAARARQPGFVMTSFATIAGFNANGALPHYRAYEHAHATISTPLGLTASGLLLIDSGGQYLGGTTDITRVWAIGAISEAHKRDFTLVLKGLIALSRLRFPVGTLAPMLDAVARAPLWAEQLDYGHGTGHGVGYFLNVHEGPQSISKALPHPDMAMQVGMVTSIEPAIYRVGQWGIRLENLVANRGLAPLEPGADGFLEFETLTLCPIDTRCIDVKLLSEDERLWLNTYHEQVYQRVLPHVSDADGSVQAWLRLRTAPI